MKSAAYALVVMILVGLAVAGALIYLGAPKSARQESAPARDSSPQKTVYVDISKLIPMHPSYEFVKQSTMVMAGVRRETPGQPVEMPWLRIAPVKLDIKHPVVSREELESDVVWSAVQSLTQWENRLKQSLQARLKGNWKTLKQVANSEIRLATREIEDQAAEDRRAVIVKYLFPRLNAFAKYSAAERATKIPGFQSPSITQSYEVAKAEYESMMAEYNAELGKIEAKAKQQVGAVRKEATERAETSLAVVERQGTRKIAQRVAEIREEIINDTELASAASRETSIDMSSFRQIDMSEALIVPQLPLSAAGSVPTVSVADVSAAITRDVTQAVRRIAGEKRLEVVFTRGPAPDSTEVFAQEMRSRLWWGQGPVLAEVGGKISWK